VYEPPAEKTLEQLNEVDPFVDMVSCFVSEKSLHYRFILVLHFSYLDPTMFPGKEIPLHCDC
jgi:hypothetical protein